MSPSNTKPLYVIGAYGRTYVNEQDALRDWNDGKDFKIVRGPYLSMRDMRRLREDGYTSVLIDLSPSNALVKWAEVDLTAGAVM